MKKILIAFAAMLVLMSAGAQRYYYTAPWDGNKSYMLNVGANLSLAQPSFSNAYATSLDPGLAVTFRYEGDKNINEYLSWGYQFETGYLAQGAHFDYIGYLNEHYDVNWWVAPVEVRFSFSYWTMENLELQLAAGVGYSLFYGTHGEKYAFGVGGLEVPGTREETGKAVDFFSSDMWVSTMLQAKYFFSETLFVSLSVHDNIGIGAFGGGSYDIGYTYQGGQRGMVMAGVGFKVMQ